MSFLHGRVQGGRIVIEEAVDLPEGAEVRLALVEPADDEDQLDAEDRARLDPRRAGPGPAPIPSNGRPIWKHTRVVRH